MKQPLLAGGMVSNPWIMSPDEDRSQQTELAEVPPKLTMPPQDTADRAPAIDSKEPPAEAPSAMETPVNLMTAMLPMDLESPEDLYSLSAWLKKEGHKTLTSTIQKFFQ
eukprot:gene27815-34355_t